MPEGVRLDVRLKALPDRDVATDVHTGPPRRPSMALIYNVGADLGV
jgi:hypothetical protein